MQQRQLRLGDILDDYCPRERRITNHAVVAMIDQEVKQTRCTTCDSDHEYKHARVPPARRKKEAMSAAFSEVLASVQQDAAVGTIRVPDAAADKAAPRRLDAKPPAAEEPAPATVEAESQPAPVPVEAAPESAPLVEAAVEPAGAPGADDQSRNQEEGPVHRRLIRATLPRTDATVVRPVPQFTMREPAPRGGHFRAKGAHRPHQQGGGPRPHGRPALPKHAGSTRKGGFGQHPRPARPGHGAPPSRPGKKHSR